MTLSPRADEVASVLEVLLATDPEGRPLYDDETAMAEAIVRALGAKLEHRETWAIIPGDSPFAYGLYWYMGEAEKAWEGLIGPVLGGEARLIRTVPWGRDHGTIQATDCVCSHAKEQHVVRNLRGGKASGPTVCGVYRRREKCPCKGYTRRSA